MMGFFWKVKDNEVVEDEEFKRFRLALEDLKKAIIKELTPPLERFLEWIKRKFRKD